MQPNTYKYMQIHTNTNKYIQIHTNINKYTQIRTNSSKWIIVYSFHIKKKSWKRQKLSADFALKNRRWYHYFSFNFSAKRAKLTSRCFLRSEIYVFAAFWFDEKRHPIRKVSPSPVSADSAPIFHSENEIGALQTVSEEAPTTVRATLFLAFNFSGRLLKMIVPERFGQRPNREPLLLSGGARSVMFLTICR